MDSGASGGTTEVRAGSATGPLHLVLTGGTGFLFDVASFTVS